MSWLDALLGGIKNVFIGGAQVPAPQGAPLNFVSGATGSYNVVTGAVDITVTAAGSFLTAKGFGAYGDNSHNDTAAITAALAAAALSGSGSRVYLTPGTYLVNSIAVPDNVTLEGDGQGRSVLNVDNTNNSVNSGAGVKLGNGCSLKHLTVEGTSKIAVLVGNSTGVLIDDCEITGGTYSSIGDNVTAGVAVGSPGAGGSDLTIQNCYIHNNGSNSLAGNGEIYGYSVYPNERISVLNNRIVCNPSAEGICIFNASDCLLDGNYVDQQNVISSSTAVGGYGIIMYYSLPPPGGANPLNRNTIVNNRVRNCAGSGIYYQSGPYPPDSGNSFPSSIEPDAVITGNIVENTCQQQLDSSLLVGGIACNASRAIIANNHIVLTGPQGSGVAFQGNGVIVSNNVITNVPARPAIHLDVVQIGAPGAWTDEHAGTRALITGNHIIDCLNDGIATNTLSVDQLKVANNTIGFNYTSVVPSSGSDNFTIYGTTFSNGQTVRLQTIGGTLAAPLTQQGVYYVINWNGTNPAAATFQLSASSGGSAIGLTTSGSGLQEICVTPASGGSGIYIQGGCTNSTFANNHIEGVRNHGIAIQAGTGSNEYNTITGNSVISTSLQTLGAYYAFYNTGNRTVIQGNHVVGGTAYAIDDLGTNSIIVGNDFSGGSGSPAYAWDSSSVVSSNWFESPNGLNRIVAGTAVDLVAPNVTMRGSYTASPDVEFTISTGGNTIVSLAHTLELGNNVLVDGSVTSSSLTVNGISTFGNTSSTDNLAVVSKTQSTVGGTGGASPLPVTPVGYLLIVVNSTEYAIPYYLKA